MTSVGRVQGVRVAQLEEAWAVNHTVGSTSLGCANVITSFSQAVTSKLLNFSSLYLKFEALCTTIMS